MDFQQTSNIVFLNDCLGFLLVLTLNHVQLGKKDKKVNYVLIKSTDVHFIN